MFCKDRLQAVCKLCVVQLTGMLQYVVRCATEVDARFNSVERMLEYITVWLEKSLPEKHISHAAWLLPKNHPSYPSTVHPKINIQSSSAYPDSDESGDESTKHLGSTQLSSKQQNMLCIIVLFTYLHIIYTLLG